MKILKYTKGNNYLVQFQVDPGGVSCDRQRFALAWNNNGRNSRRGRLLRLLVISLSPCPWLFPNHLLPTNGQPFFIFNFKRSTLIFVNEIDKERELFMSLCN